MNKIDKQKTIKAVVGIVTGAIVLLLVQQVIFKKPSYDKVMMEAASEINKSYPLMIDRDTRLDNTIAQPDNIFQCNYTLVNTAKGKVDTDDLKKFMEPKIVNSVKENPDLKFYRDHKTTIVYQYRDKNGEFLIKISVTPQKDKN